MARRRRRKSDILFHVLDKSEILFAVLLHEVPSSKYLAELSYLFGVEEVQEFIKIFAGRSIRVPKAKTIQSIAERVEIWWKYKNGMSEEDILRSIESKRGKTLEYIRNSIKKVEDVYVKMCKELIGTGNGKEA